MELFRSTVHRGLDVRMKVAGMEALDLIAALILAAVMNLFRLPTFLILGIPSTALIILYLGKRGKPDGFLIHLLRYYLTPGLYSAAQESRNDNQLQMKIHEK
ncbi:MAG: hypothetical protein K2X47_01360 [Bdellovibrionales bacterium]|nr:hypothetical protein [Bdellovibrionales bacterium]